MAIEPPSPVKRQKPELTRIPSQQILNELFKQDYYNRTSLKRVQTEERWTNQYIVRIAGVLKNIFYVFSKNSSEEHNKYYNNALQEHAEFLSKNEADKLQALLEEYEKFFNKSESSDKLPELSKKIENVTPKELSKIRDKFYNNPRPHAYKLIKKYAVIQKEEIFKDLLAKFTGEDKNQCFQCLLELQVREISDMALLCFNEKNHVFKNEYQLGFEAQNPIFRKFNHFFTDVIPKCEQEIARLDNAITHYGSLNENHIGRMDAFERDYDQFALNLVKEMQTKFMEEHRKKIRLICDASVHSTPPNWQALIERAEKVVLNCFQFAPKIKCETDLFRHEITFSYLKSKSFKLGDSSQSKLVTPEECFRRINYLSVELDNHSEHIINILSKMVEHLAENSKEDNQKLQNLKNYMCEPKENNLWAILSNQESETIDLEQYLSKETVNCIYPIRNYTPIHFATYSQRVDCVKKLLDFGADPFIYTHENVLHIPLKQSCKTTSIQLAAALSNTEILKLFIAKMNGSNNDHLSEVLKCALDPYSIIDAAKLSQETKVILDKQWDENAFECLKALQPYVQDVIIILDSILDKRKLAIKEEKFTLKPIIYIQMREFLIKNSKNKENVDSIPPRSAHPFRKSTEAGFFSRMWNSNKKDSNSTPVPETPSKVHKSPSPIRRSTAPIRANFDPGLAPISEYPLHLTD